MRAHSAIGCRTRPEGGPNSPPAFLPHANDDPRTGDSGGAVMTCGAFDAGGYGGADGMTGEGGADAFG